MSFGRPFAVSTVSALVLMAGTATATHAAFQTVELSAAGAPPGHTVTMRVEISAREAETAARPLVLVSAAAFDQAPETVRCEDVPGATVVGETTWRSGPVEYDGTSYPGFIGEATFVVPDVPLGSYYLAEAINSVGTGCHPFTGFTVTDHVLPDTALGAVRVLGLPVVVASIAMIMAGAMGAVFGIRRRASRR